jgi:hypothetical protein
MSNDVEFLVLEAQASYNGRHGVGSSAKQPS